MMDRDTHVDTVLHFVVTVEINSQQVSPEKVRQRLGDACLWMEGTGHIDVDFKGELEHASE